MGHAMDGRARRFFRSVDCSSARVEKTFMQKQFCFHLEVRQTGDRPSEVFAVLCNDRLIENAIGVSKQFYLQHVFTRTHHTVSVQNRFRSILQQFRLR